jgi:nucleotide-binding universal stress UspA family protein
VSTSSGSPETTGLVVVGVDGSPGSHHALEFAVAEARLRGARVQAVMAWQMPVMVDPQVTLQDFDPEGWSRTGLDEVLATVSTGEVPVESRLVQGHPAGILIDASADADLLVVGSRGHGGFVGALLGSVSHRCVAHATCPVVVVPPPRSPNGG